MSGGREYGRKGPVNAVRRWLYGLFLGSCSVHAHASEAPKVPQKPKSQSPQWQYSGGHQQPRLRMLDHPQPLGHHPRVPPWGSLDESTLFAARFNMQATSVIPGVDVDFNLAGFANLHFLLNSNPAAADAGRRWALTTGDDGALRRARKSCSLSASLDFVQVAPYGERKLVFFPELRFALDTMLGAPDGMSAAMRYSQWSAGPGEKGALDVKVTQLMVSWSF